MSKNVKRELFKLVKKEDILAAQITIFDYGEVDSYKPIKTLSGHTDRVWECIIQFR